MPSTLPNPSFPNCKSLTEDIRIYLCDELVWVYSREYKYPQYIGAGTYNRLARLYIQETLESEGVTDNEGESDRSS